jgi:membrane dipeptidase
MPGKLNRREFLKLLGLTLGIAACQRLPLNSHAPTGTLTPEPTTTLSVTLTPSGTTATLEAAPTYSAFASSTISPAAQPPVASLAPQQPFPSFIIDAHQDIAWNALEFDRDIRSSALDVRIAEGSSDAPQLIGERTTGLPEYLAGRVGIIFATIYVSPAGNAYPGHNRLVYNNPGQAEAHGWAELEYYRQLAENEPRFRIIASLADLDGVIASWTQPGQQPVVGLVILLEGADPMVHPGDLEKWRQAGVRIIGLAWHATRYSGGTGAPGPLTDLGRQLLENMAKVNMVLDLSHLSQDAYWETIRSYPGPMIASHSNPHKFLPTDRGLSDKMIQELVARDGVIGVNFYNRFLQPGWTEGDSRRSVTLETIADVIDDIVQSAGSARNVGIGSDLDGGFGLNAIPAGMDTAADFVNIVSVLEKRGYTREDIERIMNGNWLRVLRKSL